MQQNRSLAKAIGGAGWGGLRIEIAYKAERAGKHFVALDQWAATSKTCFACGERAAEMPLSVRHWTCANCGSEHDRNINAALNIKRLGILELRAGGVHVPACGGLHKTGDMPAAADEAGSRAARAA
jgi:putative transposase